MSDLMEAIANLEMKYANDITSATGTRNYFKIGDNDIQELVSEVEIEKLVSLGYFDNQQYTIFSQYFPDQVSGQSPKALTVMTR